MRIWASSGIGLGDGRHRKSVVIGGLPLDGMKLGTFEEFMRGYDFPESC
jgi:hypothetical protein